MNFINAEGKEDFLNYEDLTNNSQVYRIAYVVDVSSSTSRLDKPFYTLFVRTTEGVVLPCFIFEIENFVSLGFKLNMMKGKYVRLNAKVTEDEGRVMLNFINLELVSPTPEIISTFQKKIADIEQYSEDLNKWFMGYLGKPLSAHLSLVSYPEVYNGYVGGYVKLCWDVLMHVMAVTRDEPIEEMAEVLYNVFTYYNAYLETKSKINIITDSDKIDILMKMPSGDFAKTISRNTMAVLMGLGQPDHPISILLDSTFKFVNLNVAVKFSWKSLRPGGVFKCEDYQLSRY